MDFKQIVGELSEELKKEQPDRRILADKVNRLISAYNEVVRAAKTPAPSPAGDDRIAELKKDIDKAEKKYKKKVIDLQTIFEIAKDLAGSLNLDNLIKSIVLTTMGHLLAETGVIFVLDEAGGRYTVRAVKGIKEGVEGLSFKADEALVGELAGEGRAVPVAELPQRPGVAGLEDIFNRTHAQLCVPILSKSKVNGILMLGPRAGGLPFTESNLEFLVTLGNFAAVAIENAKLYESLDRKVKDLSSLYNISREINRSNDMETVLDLMLETLTTGFGVVRCSVALFDELKGIYHLERCVGIGEPESQKYLEIILSLSDPLGTGEAVRVDSTPEVDPGDLLFSVPLIAGNRKVGLLNIFRFQEGMRYSEEAVQIFSIIASQMAPPLVLAQYLSARNVYRENPFDFIYHSIKAMVESSQAGSVGFTACRLKIAAAGSREEFKTLMQGVRTMLQETDVMIHSSFNELVILFPASPKEEVQGLLDSVIASLVGPQIDRRVVSFPDEAGDADKMLSILFS